MTVEELIKLLHYFPGNAEVFMPYREEIKTVEYDVMHNEVNLRY